MRAQNKLSEVSTASRFSIPPSRYRYLTCGPRPPSPVPLFLHSPVPPFLPFPRTELGRKFNPFTNNG